VRNLMLLLFGGVLISLSGCEGLPPPKRLGVSPSPDGALQLSVIRLERGINATITTVHVLRKGEEETDRNIVFRTSDCSEAEALWSGERDVVVRFAYAFVTLYRSKDVDVGVRVKLEDRGAVGGSERGGISLKCDRPGSP
jgi:hypothetical protein